MEKTILWLRKGNMRFYSGTQILETSINKGITVFSSKLNNYLLTAVLKAKHSSLQAPKLLNDCKKNTIIGGHPQTILKYFKMQFPWAAHNWPEAMMLLLSSSATSSASSFFFLYFWHILNVILPGLKQNTVVHETKENNYKHPPYQTIKWVKLKQNPGNFDQMWRCYCN